MWGDARDVAALMHQKLVSLRVFNDSGVGTGNALMVVHPQYGSRNVTKSLNSLREIMKWAN